MRQVPTTSQMMTNTGSRAKSFDCALVSTLETYNDPENGKMFVEDLKNRIIKLSKKQAFGLMYWEPQAYNWKNYSLGAFDNTGKPTKILDPFLN